MMSEIKNLLTVSERLVCAGQPDENQLIEIADRGFQVVINLGLSDGKYALPDEANSVTRLGLSYYHIPVLFDNPQIADWQSFRSIMDQQEDKSQLVPIEMYFDNFRLIKFKHHEASSDFQRHQQQ